MKILFFFLAVMLLTILLSAVALAHPGHDHNDAGAGLIHLLWLVPFIIAAVVLVFKEITDSSATNKKSDRR